MALFPSANDIFIASPSRVVILQPERGRTFSLHSLLNLQPQFPARFRVKVGWTDQLVCP